MLYFKIIPFSSSCRKYTGSLLWYLLWKFCREPRGKSHKIVFPSRLLGFPGLFNSQCGPHWASSYFINYNSGFSTQHCSPQIFSSSLSKNSGRDFSCAFHVLIDPGSVVDFSVCSAYYLLEQSGDYQASYMWNQNKHKSDVAFSGEITFIF